MKNRFPITKTTFKDNWFDSINNEAHIESPATNTSVGHHILGAQPATHQVVQPTQAIPVTPDPDVPVQRKRSSSGAHYFRESLLLLSLMVVSLAVMSVTFVKVQEKKYETTQLEKTSHLHKTKHSAARSGSLHDPNAPASHLAHHFHHQPAQHNFPHHQRGPIEPRNLPPLPDHIDIPLLFFTVHITVPHNEHKVSSY